MSLESLPAAAILDMDGLIIDSEPFWRQSHVEVVTAHGGAQITEDHIREMAGHRTDEVVEHWRQIFDLNGVSAETLEQEVVAQVVANINTQGQALPGVYRLLELFRAHNVPIAIASSSAPNIIDAVVRRLKLSGHIELTHSAKDEKRGKPAPDVFLTAARLLGVQAASCVVFEDALSGVRAAKAADMKCIAVPEAVNLERPEFKEQADLVVPTLEAVRWGDVTNLWSVRS